MQSQFTSRSNKYCADLDRSVDELLAYDATPPALRQRRQPTHVSQVVDQYVASVAHYARWARSQGRWVFPARTRDVVDFFIYERDELKRTVDSILSDLTGLNTYHVTRDLPKPQSRDLSEYCRNLRKNRRRNKAVPFSTEDIVKMCEAIALQPALIALRDKALLLTQFAGAFRPAEARALQVSDLQFFERGVIVLVQRSKSDQMGKGQSITISRAWDPELCPVVALRNWLTFAKIESGHVFRKVFKNGRLGPDRALSPFRIALILRRHARAVGITHRVVGYCTRRGFATTAHEKGAPIEGIQRQLRHRHRETTIGYIEDRPVPFSQSLTPLVLS